MISDPIESYDEKRIDMVRKCLPPLTTATAETGPLDTHYSAYAWVKEHGTAFKGEVEMAWDTISLNDAYEVTGYHETMHNNHPLASLWAFHIQTAAGNWCVLLRIATIPLRPCTVQLADLGLPACGEFVAFAFWRRAFLRTVSGSITVPELDLGCCQVIAVRPKLDRPQMLATSRHVSMGAVSVHEQKWEDSVLTLKLGAIPDTAETFWFHVPNGWNMESAWTEGADLSEPSSDGDTVSFTVNFRSRQVTITIKWKKTGL
jgi:hypothetical protein